MAKMDRRQDSGCKPCPFSDPGGGNTSDPVYQKPPVLIDPNCFADCRVAFLLSMSEQSLDEQNYISAEGCQYLEDNQDGGRLFYALYYMDIKYCGLGQIGRSGQEPNFNSIKANCSSNYGFSNLIDPGWPSSSFQCTMCTGTTEEAVQSTTISADTTPTSSPSPSLIGSGSMTLASTGPTTTAGSASPTSSVVVASSPARATSPLATTTAPIGQLSTQGIVAIAVCTALGVASALLLLFCVLRRRRKLQEESSGGRNSRISRVTDDFTIPPADSYQPLRSPSHSMTNERPPLTPPLRLHNRKILPSLLRPLSRTDSMVFGPPFETTDHRCSSLYSTTYSQSTKHDEATATTPAGRTSFPSASNCAPTAGKLEPLQKGRQESPPQGTAASSVTTSPIVVTSEPSSPPYTRFKSPPPANFTLPPLQNFGPSSAAPKSWHRRGGPASSASKSSGKAGAGFGAYSSASTSASSNYHHHQPLSHGPRDEGHRVTGTPEPTAISAKPPLTPTLPLSLPTRPRRPHDEPLEIPDLVSPAGSPTKPPPSLPSSRVPPLPWAAAAPSPPSYPAPRIAAALDTSGLPPPSSERASASGIGVARTTGGTVAAMAPSPQGSISLQNLAGQHREGSRDSWGSWEETEMTTTGRMFGVSFPPAPGSGTLP